MGGFGDMLFGSKGEPGKIVDVTPDQFAALRGPIADALKGLITSGGGPAFPGPMAAGMSDQETALMNQAVAQAGASPLTGQSKDFLSNLLTGGGVNPHLDAAIKAAQRPTLEAYQDVVIPRLRSEFTRAGQFVQEDSSSPFDQAAALASRGLANSLADTATNMSFGSFESERNRQMQGAALAPQIESAELDRTVKGLQAASLPRLIQDLGIERGMQEFTRRVNVLLQALGLAKGAAAPNAIPVPGTEGSPGLIGQLAGAAAGPLGTAAGNWLFPVPA